MYRRQAGSYKNNKLEKKRRYSVLPSIFSLIFSKTSNVLRLTLNQCFVVREKHYSLGPSTSLNITFTVALSGVLIFCFANTHEGGSKRIPAILAIMERVSMAWTRGPGSAPSTSLLSYEVLVPGMLLAPCG